MVMRDGWDGMDGLMYVGDGSRVLYGYVKCGALGAAWA